MNTRQCNLVEIVDNLLARGIKCGLDEQGVFRATAKKGVFTEADKTGIDVCRPGLTEHLREQKGLCVTCPGTPAKATKPYYRKRPDIKPLFCRVCWQAGAWKGDIPPRKDAAL